MSDDDGESDDDILNFAVFGGNARKARAKEKEKHRHMANLNKIVASSERHTESIQRIHSLQQADEALQFDEGDDDESDKESNDDAVKEASTQPSGEETSPKSLFDLNNDEMMDESPVKKKRRMQMLEDMQDEQSSCLGVRKIISFNPKRFGGGDAGDGLTFFASKEEAEQSLTQVLQKLEKKIHGEESLLQKAAIIPLRRAMEEGCLEEFLSRSILCNTLDKYKCELIDSDITSWLLQVLQSADMSLNLRGIAQGALATLIALLKSSKVNSSFDRLSSLESFLSTLECWVDLRQAKSAPENQKASPDEIKPQEIEHNQLLPNNIGGLVNYLSLWSEAFLLIPPVQDVCMETVNRCLVALTRIGLDVSAKCRLDDTGISHSVQQLLILLIDMVAKKLENKKEAFAEWVRMAAFGVCEGLDRLGCGPPGSDDQDDECAWICYSAMARLIPDAFSNKNCCELKVAVVIRALESILEKPFSIEENAHLFAESDKKLLDRAKESLTLKTLLFSYVSLKTLQLDDDADFPRCFAIADCSLIAFQAGLMLVSVKDDTAGSEFGSIENAKHILRISNLLQREMELLCARSNRFAGNDHMRRFNYLMMLRNNIRRQTLYKLKARAGVLKSGQTDLSSFFTGNAELLASP